MTCDTTFPVRGGAFCQRHMPRCPHQARANRHPSRRWLSVCLALLLVVSQPLLAQTQAASSAYAVEIAGAGEFAPLLNDFLEIKRHQNDPDMTPEEFQRLAGSAQRQIRDLLATEGYFSPTVEYGLQRDGARLVARFNVDPGLPTRVDTLEIRFHGAIADGPLADDNRMNRLRRRWDLKQGERFRQAAWDEAKSQLLKGLLNRGYPAARIAHSEARIDPERHAAALAVEVDSGPLFTFGALQVEGLQRYSREMIDGLNPIRPGDPYSQDQLTQLQSRLQDSGYFRTVFATIEVDTAHPDRVPVRVEVVENERRRLALGGGFSTDTGARLQAKWLDRSFLGHAWRLESELRLDRETRVAGGDLYFPARSNGWYPSLGAHYQQTDTSGELNDKIRFDARMASPIKADERIWGLSYLTERQRVADVEVNHRQALVLNYTLTRRRLDNLMSPRRGYVASIELSGGLRGLINEANIGRATARLNWLSRTRRHWQALLRAQVGQVFGAGRDAVPSDLLFRTGGDQSVRGYAYNSLGVEQDGAIVGGRVMTVLSAELVYHLTPAWGAAVFRDAGNAADSWDGFQLKQGTGIGARWRSPIGPVNLDLAYGHATNETRLHFSVGYGF
jgi:translocation and assembly module TamA